MNVMHGLGKRLILFALVFTSAYAHSWVEELTVIAPNGTFVGSPGYPRGFVSRYNPSFSDASMTYLLPPNGQANFSSSDHLCMDTQRKQVQKDEYPRLQASAGAAVALRFQENGHVTLPETQKGKPPNRGTVYVYGTTDPKQDEKLLDVYNTWTEDGTGGDGRGVLLGKRDFDDGRCYQVNGGDISTRRQDEYPHEADELMGADLWCQSDIAIPENAPSGKPYTLYWIWNWPTEPGVDPGLPNGKQEMYTTCMDVDLVDQLNSRVDADPDYEEGQSLNDASIPEQFEEAVELQPGDSTAAASTPTRDDPSSSLTAASSGSATGRPVATVTVTSFVTSMKIVRPTGTT